MQPAFYFADISDTNVKMLQEAGSEITYTEPTC
jgi:hypothetical protein